MSPLAAETATLLQQRFNQQISAPKEFRGETSLEVDRAGIAEAARLLKDKGYRYLVDITSVDNMGQKPRFEIVYEFYHFEQRDYVRLRIRTGESEEVPTLTGVYATADWHEREIYDMMGIRFAGHPDLRRILMWEGYPYFPLRKDFPLEGKVSDMPGEAFSERAPLAGGPFVTAPADLTIDREPRARPAAN